MPITIREATEAEIEQAIPLLLAAEPWEPALRWGLANLVDAVYVMEYAGEIIGAATMRWRNDPCEIQELAIAAKRQGQGLGREFVEWLIAEATRRGKKQLVVGTANSSVGNMIFYQRIGLRMDHVRQDYFRYYREPRFEHGIQVRDLLVFRRDLDQEQTG